MAGVRTSSKLLARVADGYSNGEIAAFFNVSATTVEKDLRRIYKELGCAATAANCKRAEAVGIAFRKGILH